MIAYEEALRIVLDGVRPLRPVAVAPEEGLGLVLAQPVRARLQMPRHDQSAMDGIAVRVDDVAGASASSPVRLELAGEIPAGSPRCPALRPGTAVKVFTGSAVPRDTGAVVMVEDCRFSESGVEVSRPARPGDHLRRAGEEVRRGDLLADAGSRLSPPLIGLLALFGVRSVKVHPAPRVGVITMGDELAAPGKKLGPTQIHDANGPALKAALNAMGIRKTRTWRVGDRKAALVRALRTALGACDVVITCGGASVGDHDHVVQARAELGIRDAFRRVAIKPGKPNVFGLAPGGIPVFSLPGNPVSALVSFHELVRPGLRAMMGREATLPEESARITASRKRMPGRLEWLRGIMGEEDGVATATPLDVQGSHMLTGLVRADALIQVDADVAEVKRGDRVGLRRLQWFE